MQFCIAADSFTVSCHSRFKSCVETCHINVARMFDVDKRQFNNLITRRCEYSM